MSADTASLREAIEEWDRYPITGNANGRLLIAAARLVLSARDAESDVETVARALVVSRGGDPMTLYQSSDIEDYPVDATEHIQGMFGKPAHDILLHYAWRRQVKHARAALRAISLRSPEVSEEMVSAAIEGYRSAYYPTIDARMRAALQAALAARAAPSALAPPPAAKVTREEVSQLLFKWFTSGDGLDMDDCIRFRDELSDAILSLFGAQPAKVTREEVARAACGSGVLCVDPIDGRMAGSCHLCGGVADRVAALFGARP